MWRIIAPVCHLPVPLLRKCTRETTYAAVRWRAASRPGKTFIPAEILRKPAIDEAEMSMVRTTRHDYQILKRINFPSR